MKRLTQTRFFGLVEAPQECPDPRLLQAAWYDFADSVVVLTFSDEPFLVRHNTIAFTLAEMTVLYEKIAALQDSEGHAEMLQEFIQKAKFLLDTQFNLLKLSLEYSNSFLPQSRDKIVSPFGWSDEFSKNDLIEIISSLSLVGAATDRASGGKASYSSLVRGFEVFFNISLPRSDRKRDEVLNRKIKPASFLSRLIHALTDRSQR